MYLYDVFTAPYSRFLSLPQSLSRSLVNNTNELGQLEEMNVPANETRITLYNLKYSTRYKLYFNARTQAGQGPSINEEFATIMDAGKLHE